MQRKYREYLVIIAYILWLFSSVLGITLWRNYEAIELFRTYGVQVSYLILVATFFLKEQYSRKDILGLLCIIFCCIVAAKSTHHKHIIPTMIFVYFMSEIYYKKILKITLVLQLIIMAITVVASQMGIIEDVIWTEGDRIRHSLGYDYCGYPGHLLLFMTLALFCIKDNIKVLEYIGIVVLNYVIYVKTDARTDFYLSILGIIGFVVIYRRWRFQWVLWLINNIIKYFYSITAIISITIHWVYNEEFYVWQKINSILNGRLKLGHDAIIQYGFTLFGKKIRWNGQGSIKIDPTRVYNYVDCSYLKEALSFGIIFLILLGIGFYIFGKYAVFYEEIKLSWAVIITCLYAIINAHLCVLTFNVFILVLGCCFSKNIISREIKKERES